MENQLQEARTHTPSSMSSAFDPKTAGRSLSPPPFQLKSEAPIQMARIKIDDQNVIDTNEHHLNELEDLRTYLQVNGKIHEAILIQEAIEGGEYRDFERVRFQEYMNMTQPMEEGTEFLPVLAECENMRFLQPGLDWVK
ncbi:MAG: hypothetical protein AAF570_17855, partial [Bacteroidota bacterium]